MTINKIKIAQLFSLILTLLLITGCSLFIDIKDGPPDTCGNGVVESNEECDGTSFINMNSCADIGGHNTDLSLVCGSDCKIDRAACGEIQCFDGIDDDNDGFIDCYDTDCIDTATCEYSEICNDGIDNDGDGDIDCDDASCFSNQICFSGEICDNGIDDNGDGDIDCDDMDCLTAPSCDTNNTNNEDCVDGIDNNGDGHIDCQDPECFGVSECENIEICYDDIDNDGDGFIDCESWECQGIEGCGESHCYDGVDNDGDGLLDCDDDDCQGAPECTNPEICDNNVDDNGNGYVDCADWACQAVCGETKCQNNYDDDGDGEIDCDDADCFGTTICTGGICDFIKDTGCASGESCYLHVGDVISCDPINTGDQGFPCTDSSDCFGGFYCFDEIGNMFCAKFCEVDEVPSECAAPLTCSPVTVAPDLGLCL